MRLAQLALHHHCAVQVQKVELLGIGVDLGLDRLGDQRGLALHVQDRLLGVEQGAVEGDGAVVEVQPSDGALDGNAVVAGDIEDERVEDLQAGQAHHQAGDRTATQARRDIAVGCRHDLGQRAAGAGQHDAALHLAVGGIEVA